MERIGAYVMPGAELGQAVEVAREAEAQGYDSLWVTHGAGRDSFVVLSAYTHATESIRLGNGVVPIYPRHPVALAQEALTLNELSGGRFSLGIGVSHRAMMVDALGLDMGSPLGSIREYVTVLRSALSGQVAHTGSRYRAHWKSALPRSPAPPPVLLAGLSAKMIELAGEIADGVILWLCAPAYIQETVVPAVARGRAKAGKSPEGFEVVAAVPGALTENVEGTTTLFKEELTRYLLLPFYRAMLAASRFGDALAAFDRDRSSGASPAQAVPDQLARALGAIGDRALIQNYVATHRRAGVTLPAVRPIGFPEAPHYRPTLGAVAPRTVPRVGERRAHA